MINLQLTDGETIRFNEQQEEAAGNILEWYHSGDKLSRLSGFAGTGKMQPNTEPVLTPDGWKLMGDIEPGDKVSCPLTGLSNKILEVFPKKSLRIYRMLFSDGSSTECCEDHLWRIQTSKMRTNGTHRVKSTKELLADYQDKNAAKGWKYSIETPNAIEFSSVAKLPVHPYLLGWLLGDGYLCPDTGGINAAVSISVNVSDYEEVAASLSEILPEDCSLSIEKYYETTPGVRKLKIFGLAPYLQELELFKLRSRDKYIPEQYLRGSIDDRRKLLAGLMDTDGSVTSSGSSRKLRFTTFSSQLSTDFLELTRSLGGIASLSISTRSKYPEGTIDHQISLRLRFNPFVRAYKALSYGNHKSKYKFSKSIVGIEFIGLKDGKCILVDSDEHLYITRGYNVTHNTTITKYVIAKLQEASVLKRAMRICVAAPTHKALKVIVAATGFPGHTLARLLGMSADIGLEDFDPEKPEFKQKKPPIIGDYDLVVLDEISMVNTKLFEAILKEVAKSSTVRILFLGDSFQTPPIGEKISPIFTSEDIEWASELTKVERQDDDDPILDIHAAIRNNPNSYSDNFEHVSHTNSRGHGIQFLDNSNFAGEVLKAFTSEAYTEDPDYAKILCWTNDQCKYWNINLRRRRMLAIHGPTDSGQYSPIMQGDVMMAFSGYENKLANSNDYLILRVEESDFDINYPVKGGKAKLTVSTFGVWYVNVDTGKQGFTHVLDQRDDDNEQKWLKAYWAFVNAAKKFNNWKEFFEFRSWVMLYEDIPLGFDGKKKIRKDLDYGYAITVHKSTGSSYENVFVDGSNIDNNPTHSERNRLKYVALSRQRKMAYYRE